MPFPYSPSTSTEDTATTLGGASLYNTIEANNASAAIRLPSHASYRESLPNNLNNEETPLQTPYEYEEISYSEDESLPELDRKYMRQTTFLLYTDTEPDFSPVHVPFRYFSEVSRFFSVMMNECVLREDNDAIQEDREPEFFNPIDRISDASVRFDWCEYGILIYPGDNHAWLRVMAKLRDEWNLVREGKDAPCDGFNITVRLHLKGPI
ncbi:hypothetical protein Plec18170_009718 [Paecilomyces lecythidis]